MIAPVVILVVCVLILSIVAFRLKQQRDDYRRANEIRAQSIEDTRRGNPPFLLNPGVKIVKEEINGPQ